MNAAMLRSKWILTRQQSGGMALCSGRTAGSVQGPRSTRMHTDRCHHVAWELRTQRWYSIRQSPRMRLHAQQQEAEPGTSEEEKADQVCVVRVPQHASSLTATGHAVDNRSIFDFCTAFQAPAGRLGSVAAAAAAAVAIFLGGVQVGAHLPPDAAFATAPAAPSPVLAREQSAGQQQALQQLQQPDTQPALGQSYQEAAEAQKDTAMQQAQQAGLSADETSTIRVFQDSTPSVVNITNIRALQSYYSSSMDMQKVPVGSGSGFIW